MATSALAGQAEALPSFAARKKPEFHFLAATVIVGREGVAAARQWTKGILGEFALESLIDDALLLVSELTSNAVEAEEDIIRPDEKPEILLVLGRPDRAQVYMGVYDESPELPDPKDASLAEDSGRGLRIVGTLSAEWGCQPLPHGKCVWAVINAA